MRSACDKISMKSLFKAHPPPFFFKMKQERGLKAAFKAISGPPNARSSKIKLKNNVDTVDI